MNFYLLGSFVYAKLLFWRINVYVKGMTHFFLDIASNKSGLDS